MTIAISIKVDEGLVLVADSASTLTLRDASGNPCYGNVYNNARKLFRLHDNLPVGALTWGANNIGRASIKMLAKDFRVAISDSTSPFFIDQNNYTIEMISENLKTFIYDNHYQPVFTTRPWPDFGLLVAGYSYGKSMGEVWMFDVDKNNGTCSSCTTLKARDATGGIDWYGMPTSLHRLIMGLDPDLHSILVQGGVDQDVATTLVTTCESILKVTVAYDSMAIQDAIDLGVFLAETAKRFTRFCLGRYDSVGGPIEVAVITRYEGFKWVRRKHFYDKALND